MESEVNRVILGFAHRVGGEVSLAPISSASQGRRVGVGKFDSSGKISFYMVLEPFHDSNKMYASIRGAPSNQIVLVRCDSAPKFHH